MAEALAIVASVVQLVQLSGQLLAGGYGFLSRVSNAPAEIRYLLTETAAVNSLLSQLEILSNSKINPAHENALQSLKRLGVFHDCGTTLEFIRKALAKCEKGHGKDVTNLTRRLLWPFKEKETKDAFARLYRLRELLTTALQANTRAALQRIEENQQCIINEVEFLSDNARTQISREETQTIMSWLRLPPADAAQVSLDTALSLRTTGTGAWFLESKTFEDWHMSNAGAIWIVGFPGSGKTLLCSSIIERVRVACTSPTTVVLFFFCDRRDSSKQTKESLLINVTRQILDTSPKCLQKAKELYEEKQKRSSGRTFNSSEYLPLIDSCLRDFREVFLILDALDEASEPLEIAEILSHMYELGYQHGVSVKLLLTSRFDVQLEKLLGSIISSRVSLVDTTLPDIEYYVKVEMQERLREGILKVRDKELIPFIQSRVSNEAGTILQAKMRLDYLSTARNDKSLKGMLETLPSGLESTYETILCSLASRYPQRTDDIKVLLRCLVAATSPLSATQLSEIIAMEPRKRRLDRDAVNTDSFDTLEVIAPLVTIDRDKIIDGIQLSHYTVKEYLCSKAILQGNAKNFYVDPRQANAWLSAICLQYLSFFIFDLPVERDATSRELEAPSQYELLPYAALNWFTHMHNARGFPRTEDYYQPYLNWFMNGANCYDRWQRVFINSYPRPRARCLSRICFAIDAGLDELFDYLYPNLQDINCCHIGNHACLHVAAAANQVIISQKLLDLGAIVDLKTPDRGLTPLHFAAENGCQETFNLLINHGADPHARSRSETTPFYRAARGGSIYILTRLREWGSDVNAQTWDAWTPLLEAVEHGHEDVVDLLLQWGADPLMRSSQGYTPLSLARLLPYHAITKRLEQAVSQHLGVSEERSLTIREKNCSHGGLLEDDVDLEGPNSWKPN
ncbi:ankyrin [Lindgomyces ingoldianus]|uniref:Ankyrin n=1 Tax=Lindgomyces ingoldianus TaxID=673940 RepID=A0ACB6QK71_9PLEO|nr:ankyrin [Lindgomyces ingoldianus]KAF2467414.1 ankyrin [Lindgomyces ingoldianus]